MPSPGHASDGDGRQTNAPHQLQSTGDLFPPALIDDAPVPSGTWIEDNFYDAPEFAMFRADRRISVSNNPSASVPPHARPTTSHSAPYRSLQDVHQVASHNRLQPPKRGNPPSVSSIEGQEATGIRREFTSHNDTTLSYTNPFTLAPPTHFFSPEVVSGSPSTSAVQSDSLSVSQTNAGAQDIVCTTKPGLASATTTSDANVNVPGSDLAAPAIRHPPLLNNCLSEEPSPSLSTANNSATHIDLKPTADGSLHISSHEVMASTMNSHHIDNEVRADSIPIDIDRQGTRPHARRSPHCTPPNLCINTETERRSKIRTIYEMQELDNNSLLPRAHASQSTTSHSPSTLEVPFHHSPSAASPTVNHDPRSRSVNSDERSRSQSHISSAASSLPPASVAVTRGGLYDDPFLRLPNRISSYQVVPVSQMDINPNDILDDGDDGFIETKRKTVLGLPVGISKSNNASRSTLSNGKLPGTESGSGSTLTVPQIAILKGRPAVENLSGTTSVDSGEMGSGGGMIDSDSLPSASPLYPVIMTERSAWLDQDKSSRRKMRYILCGILAFLIIGAIVGGIVGGVLRH
ncbi:hypothetical protein KEM56_005381 [Ascosphaera pollenicola]|nr:hypothetical protein KEM56_005381 [Ascosphaera pollenicola]